MFGRYEDGVHIGPSVALYCHNFGHGVLTFKPVVVGADTVIYGYSAVLPGTTFGRGTVVGPMSMLLPGRYDPTPLYEQTGAAADAEANRYALTNAEAGDIAVDKSDRAEGFCKYLQGNPARECAGRGERVGEWLHKRTVGTRPRLMDVALEEDVDVGAIRSWCCTRTPQSQRSRGGYRELSDSHHRRQPTLSFTIEDETTTTLRESIEGKWGADSNGSTTRSRSERHHKRVTITGECSFTYRYILRESCSQFDSLPLTSLTILPSSDDDHSDGRRITLALALAPRIDPYR